MQKGLRYRRTYGERKQQLLDIAVDVAEKAGCDGLNARNVAEKAGVSYSLVRNHFPSTQNLYESVFKEAIRVENLGVIAQGIEYEFPLPQEIPAPLREKAVLYQKGVRK